MNFIRSFIFCISTIFIITQQTLLADDGIELSVGADFVSRYTWRGLIINEAPNIQPSITLSKGSFEFGTWGSSMLSKTNESDGCYALSHEIDIWAGYSYEFTSGMSLGLFVTDYYFPNTGLEFTNFNNYDNEDGAGAHTIEMGLALSGSDILPIGVSAFMNLYNDEGKNAYFQFDYSTSIKEIGVGIVIGATGGSSENPDYYGAKDFSIINVGLTVSKEIKITDSFYLPIFVNYTVNPLNDISHLVFGFSL